MNEGDFLQTYDPGAFDRPSLAVDIVLLTVTGGHLCALLRQRSAHPDKGKWALPGGFVGIDEGLDAAAERVLAAKVGLTGQGWLEQLYTFGQPDRDPRMRIVTVAYYALVPPDVFDRALASTPGLALARLEVPWPGEHGGAVAAIDRDGSPLPLAFDHAGILGAAVKRMRGKLDYSPVAFSLLPERFTLRQLQDVHEAILGTALNKPAFRRRMLDRGWIEGTGEREQGAAYRPAELYRVKPA